jgi:hypothetical protein
LPCCHDPRERLLHQVLHDLSVTDAGSDGPAAAAGPAPERRHATARWWADQRSNPLLPRPRDVNPGGGGRPGPTRPGRGLRAPRGLRHGSSRNESFLVESAITWSWSPRAVLPGNRETARGGPASTTGPREQRKSVEASCQGRSRSIRRSSTTVSPATVRSRFPPSRLLGHCWAAVRAAIGRRYRFLWERRRLSGRYGQAIRHNRVKRWPTCHSQGRHEAMREGGAPTGALGWPRRPRWHCWGRSLLPAITCVHLDRPGNNVGVDPALDRRGDARARVARATS